MDTSLALDDLALLHAKLDHLTNLLEGQRRRQQEMDELKRDLIPIANQMVQLTIDQLAEIDSEFQLEDLLYLLKRLLRNTRKLVMALDRLDAVMGLADEATLIGPQVFDQAVETLDQLERKGYFRLARQGGRIVDQIVTEFSEDDVRLLGDNIVLILNTIKDLTQPEILRFVRSTLLIAEQEIDKPVDVSYGGLLRQMRDPAVRRGLALTMRVLHVIGAPADDRERPQAAGGLSPG
ncbi:MAG: DUF1641 domain-containing protein [Anaerolineales bacterium]|nr:DUF1641 domain-containing protein [Anaerolineales bacterium]